MIEYFKKIKKKSKRKPKMRKLNLIFEVILIESVLCLFETTKLNINKTSSDAHKRYKLLNWSTNRERGIYNGNFFFEKIKFLNWFIFTDPRYVDSKLNFHYYFFRVGRIW